MDRFDDIWKNRFNEEELPDADWIAPGDQVWRGITQEIKPEKPKRKWWIFVILFIGGLALLAGILGNKQQIDHLEFVADKNTTFVNAASPKNNLELEDTRDDRKNVHEKYSSVTQIQNSGVTKENRGSAKQQISKVSETALNYNNSIQESTENYVVQKQKIPTAQLEENITVLESGEGVKKEQAVEILFGEHEVGDLQPLTLSSLSGIAVVAAPKPLGQLSPVETMELPNKKAPIRFGISGGAIHWKHRISEDYIKDFAAFDFNYTNQWGWQISGEIDWIFNDYFALTSGVQYQRIQTSSGHNSPLTYNTSLERDGERNNDYALSLATPYGLAPAEFSFLRKQEIGSASLGLLVDFNSNHTIHNLSIPVGITVFPLGQQRAFSPHVNVAFGMNYIAGLDNEIESIQTNHDAIRFVKETSQLDRQEVETLHYDLRLGAGFNYRLSKTMGVHFQYQWMRGLNPLFQVEDYATKIDRHLLTLGLNYRLGR
ncbi:MAG: hypothetical protein AAF985_03340 [Bacteroidota bacterium]